MLRASITVSLFAVVTGALEAQQDAVSFTNLGGNQHIDLPVSPLTVPARGFTIEAWITYDDSTIGTGAPWRWPTICRHTPSPGESYFLRVQAAQSAGRVLRFTVRDASNTNRHANYPFAAGEFANWTHVAATYDGQTSRLYVNGTQVATANAPGPITVGNGHLRIGEGADAVGGAVGTEVWNGAIDEFRLWPFPRTVEEIQSTMNQSVVAIPGGVSMDFSGGVFVDTSQGFTATSVGPIGIVPGVTLPAFAAGGLPYGTASTTCAGQRTGASLGSVSMAGNQDFALYGYDGPADATGAVLLAVGSQSPAVPFLGVDFHVALGGLIPVQPPVSTDGFGTARLPLALAPTAQVGLSIYAQFLYVDSCGAQGLVGSDGLMFTIQ